MSSLLRVYGLRETRTGRRRRRTEALGMYTGLTEPVDFEVTDGAERAEKAGR